MWSNWNEWETLRLCCSIRFALHCALWINSTPPSCTFHLLCVYACVCVHVCALYVIRTPCDMPYLSARGFVGSVLFHTPPGKWVTLDQTYHLWQHVTKAKEGRGWRWEVGGEGGLTQPTRWPLKMTVKWLTYLTNAIVWRVCFSSIFPRSLTAKLLTRHMFTYHARSEKKHQTDHQVLVGLAAFCHTYLKRHS